MSAMHGSRGSHIHNEAAYSAATRRRIIENALKTWRANTPAHEEIEEFLDQKGVTLDHSGVDRGSQWFAVRKYNDGFVGSMARALDMYGKLTEKQTAAIIESIEKEKARRVEWQAQREAKNLLKEFIGVEGEDITLNLKMIFSAERFGEFGRSVFCILIDDNENTVIYSGSAGILANLEKGESATVTAKVKTHGVRDGVKQTVIQRPREPKAPKIKKPAKGAA